MASDAAVSAAWMVSAGAFANMLAGYMYEPHFGCSRICEYPKALIGEHAIALEKLGAHACMMCCIPCSSQRWMSCSPVAC